MRIAITTIGTRTGTKIPIRKVTRLEVLGTGAESKDSSRISRSKVKRAPVTRIESR